jgi:hypothetical protein
VTVAIRQAPVVLYHPDAAASSILIPAVLGRTIQFTIAECG